jgi:hypothetical protein
VIKTQSNLVTCIVFIVVMSIVAWSHSATIGDTQRPSINSIPKKPVADIANSKATLTSIGGKIMSVSSFQSGMIAAYMIDGDPSTFWHTRFAGGDAKPPHFVVMQVPKGTQITGLNYTAWTGGNGNGHVRQFAISVSDDGKAWSKPIHTGSLKIDSREQQAIVFPKATTKPFIKFQVTASRSFGLGGNRFLAAIGELDIVVAGQAKRGGNTVSTLPPRKIEPVKPRRISTGDGKLEPIMYFEQFCFDCHGEDFQMGGLNLTKLLGKNGADRSHAFENLITGKMPPRKKEKPSEAETLTMLKWLASHQNSKEAKAYRRASRHEFVHSVNDLLGIQMNVVDDIPEDRNTHDFDSSRNILLTRQQLGAYFTAADAMLDFALPADGFHPEKTWVTNAVIDSLPDYKKYIRKYKEGILFSWTRANNGNSYSFFYDKFDPPVAGWYELTFDAAKVGNFKEDVSIIVFAGKYYFADDRPQPQRLLDVISVGDKQVKPYTIRVFLKPGENVSVHCYSKHNWRQAKVSQGAYIKQLTAKGPVFEQWPPKAYQVILSGLPIKDVSTPQKRRLIVESADPKQLRRVIRSFAERAFASSLTDEELSPYYQVALDHFDKHNDFALATKASLKAIMGSHRFLLTPGFHKNKSYAKAAAIARAVWLSVPDEELLEVAAKGQLKGDVLRGQISRLLKHPNSQRMINSFSNQWLNLRTFDSVSPSLKLYPSYGDLLHHYLPLETQAYLAYLIQHNLPTNALIDSDFSILNQRLAQHYGIDGVIGQDMREIAFKSNLTRGGLMTMGSILKVTTDGGDTSPILRGAWIAKNVAGVTLSPPPENVDVLEPDLTVATTLKEQIDKHKKNKSCYACHKGIDPYGFALESFDAIGQWRTRYRVETHHNGTFQYRPQGYFKLTAAVDASGEVEGSEFTDVIGLKKVMLSNHKRVAYNFAKKYFEYIAGFKPNLKQRLYLYTLIPDKPGDSRIQKLVSDVMIYVIDRAQP